MTDSNKSPIDDLVAALRVDMEYRYGWQCNLSMMMVDRGVEPVAANEGAIAFLNQLCDSGLVDHGLGSAEPRGFEGDLRSLLNQHSKEGASDTPDFVLARYLAECLETFDRAVAARTEWYNANDLEDKLSDPKTVVHATASARASPRTSF